MLADFPHIPFTCARLQRVLTNLPMRHKVNIILILLTVLLSLTNSCKKDIMRDDDLSIQRKPYTGDQLRMDGYYYQKVDKSFFSIYFFYENGILLSAGGVFSDGNAIEEYIEKEFLKNEGYKNHKTFWGLFNIEGDTIKFERWYPSDPPLKAYVREGEILNDTTFVITESYRLVDGHRTDLTQRNEVYYFREFSPKPDSANPFVY